MICEINHSTSIAPYFMIVRENISFLLVGGENRIAVNFSLNLDINGQQPPVALPPHLATYCRF